MKRLILLAALLGSSVSAGLANDERREDAATYRRTEPDQPTMVPLAAQAAITGQAPPIAVPEALAQLRARHRADYQSLEQALLAARDNAECDALERQGVAMKHRQRRMELDWLKADALARGDTAYAALLDEALGDLEPRLLPLAGTPVPRDPATGLVLDDSGEGGDK